MAKERKTSLSKVFEAPYGGGVVNGKGKILGDDIPALMSTPMEPSPFGRWPCGGGPVTGRTASTEPKFIFTIPRQQGKTDSLRTITKMQRHAERAMGVSPGQLVKADYSDIERRVLAQLARSEAKTADDAYAEIARELYLDAYRGQVKRMLWLMFAPLLPQIDDQIGSEDFKEWKRRKWKTQDIEATQ